ncbi:LutB/LldF family L-lactate oxidation iron-sulfur protein [Gallaecimonas pentaromativorans]|uniref:L-lactate dehydrogenase complex protein LldF n=1 Tax=Gallaecimonas pentaromativorans TaxID=584787 RepID=A0A3N1NYS8_9GAMM|nr:LutB/LldF family L-lactate oxidation iron-sulfur protein [Gallaecimonas pentaromativorans]ROQ24122.1 L-lactate dehydrogenase complex protein LldF [Gallaecimonas pentaromativorans]
MAEHSPRRFTPQAQEALASPVIRQNFRGAMDYLRKARSNAFSDPVEADAVLAKAEAVRRRCLSQLPALLETLEQRCTANGIQVHWAETPAEANAIIRALCQREDAKLVAKGKSMVSEEIGLNKHLAGLGIDCRETDMGEFIVQLDGDRPSHIIMPAIHKNKDEISATFEQHLPDFEATRDVDQLIAAGRQALREKFQAAEVGLTGVNFAVAETGTLCLVENEGNGRMCSTIPRVHIAVTGIEKVVEQLSDIAPLYSALTRSATGQAITTYFNMVSSPRRPGEWDGPEEVHLVLLDNGRSQAFADDELRQTLQCIRCGACMNHCPVYGRIGGHAYGTVYPGPIGKIISPHLLGLDDAGELPTASSLCGACGEVCPVGIPIPALLQRLRVEAKHGASAGHPPLKGQGAKANRLEALAMKGFAWLARHPRCYRAGTWLARRLAPFYPRRLGAWGQCRVTPKPAPKPLSQLLKEQRRV